MNKWNTKEDWSAVPGVYIMKFKEFIYIFMVVDIMKKTQIMFTYKLCCVKVR